jgi:hypothetical protein
MAVEGLPDPKRHAICRKCLQWFPRQDGDVVWPPVTGLMSFVQVRAAKLADAEQLKQFWCRPCQERQVVRSKKAFRSTLLAIVVATVVAAVLWYTGAWTDIVNAVKRR